MYGLLLKMNQYYLDEIGVKYVMDGARSITEHSNIQPFLESKLARTHLRNGIRVLQELDRFVKDTNAIFVWRVVGKV